MDLTLVFVLNLAATGFMTGLIWFVQIVHYPLFARVGIQEFVGFHRGHSLRTTWVVAAPMVVELLTSIGLCIQAPAYLPRPLAFIGLGLVAVLWASTALLQVPQHRKLSNGFADRSCRILCRTNWVRTIAWTARLVLLLGVLRGALAVGG